MTTIKTILAPIDFSDRSAVAAQHAVAMALHYGSQVIFAHVIEAAPAEFRAHALGHAFEEGADFHAIMLAKLEAFAAAASEGVSYEAVVEVPTRRSFARWGCKNSRTAKRCCAGQRTSHRSGKRRCTSFMCRP